MAIQKTIEIDGRQVLFKASAAIPRFYRFKFRRDIFSDLAVLSAAMENSSEDESTLDIPSLELFEDIAYTMAKYADPSVPDNVEEWLDGFNTFSIYQILPELFDLWGMNMETKVDSKKKSDEPSES